MENWEEFPYLFYVEKVWIKIMKNVDSPPHNMYVDRCILISIFVYKQTTQQISSKMVHLKLFILNINVDFRDFFVQTYIYRYQMMNYVDT